ncbi:MAG: hypothetical protein J6F30_03470 [Cellulosilyticum sp.]|nr:hypothetical protein [Cellulosilyticum sp.]
MLLEEMLFCTVFFALPVVGMVGMLIARVLKEQLLGKRTESLGVASNREWRNFRKRERVLPVLAFANEKVMEYQLIESQVHMPIHFNRMKERTYPRAGPMIHKTNRDSLWNDP